MINNSGYQKLDPHIQEGTTMTNEHIKPLNLSIFKGSVDKYGRVRSRRRVGKCLFYQTTGNHVLHIDLFPGQSHTFYLKSSMSEGKDYAICLKEPMKTEPGRHLFREVGFAKLCSSPNEDLLYLEWDFVGPNDIYMQTLSFTQPNQGSHTNDLESLKQSA